MNDSIHPPPYSHAQVVERATQLIRGYCETVGLTFSRLGIGFDAVFEEFIYPEYEVELVEDRDLGFDERGEKVLGCFEPQFNRVFIDRSLQDDPRRAFTCWHEVGGHAVLQGDWLRQQIARIGVVQEVVTTASSMSMSAINMLEWQANIFAAHAAAPAQVVDYAIRKTFELNRPFCYIGPQRYSFVRSGGTKTRRVTTFEQFCNYIAYDIKHWFGGLSTQALGYRVQESKMVTDCSKQSADRSHCQFRRTARTQFNCHQKGPAKLGNLLKPVWQIDTSGEHEGARAPGEIDRKQSVSTGVKS